MRVVIADPPAYTPWYDHELAGALARAGADVELATSHFRFAELPPPVGYVRAERFYPVSSRLFRRSRARLPLKAAEHLGVARSLGRVRADVLHLQWLAVPQIDVNIKFRGPAVFTAHDLLPRRTADKLELWKRLLGKFDRVVVHTERGREALGELGIEPVVISHPVYPSTAERDDDGQTILALGVIRPYKGLADAVEVVGRLTDTRLLVAGDPAMELGDLRDAPRTEWRLGYLTPGELTGRSRTQRLRSSPTAPSSTSRGHCCRRSVPACRWWRTTSAGWRSRSPGTAPAGSFRRATWKRSRRRRSELLSDAQALLAAREGAERARSELTWDAAAVQHLELYRELG